MSSSIVLKMLNITHYFRNKKQSVGLTHINMKPMILI